jgi:hypothetical protein
MMISGSLPTALKKRNGAKLTRPVLLRLVTQPIGRGTNKLVSILLLSAFVRSDESICMGVATLPALCSPNNIPTHCQIAMKPTAPEDTGLFLPFGDQKSSLSTRSWDIQSQG